MNWLLILVAGEFALFMVYGYWRGFIRLALSLVSIVVTTVVSVVLTPVFSVLLSKKFGAGITTSVLTFLVCFLIIHIILKIIIRTLNLISRLPVLNEINKVLGIGAGIAEALIVLWLAFLCIAIFADKGTGEMVLTAVRESSILSFLYDANIFKQLILSL